MTLISPKTPKKHDGHRIINDAIQEMRKDFRIMSDKKRHTIWIDDDIWQELLCLYKQAA